MKKNGKIRNMFYFFNLDKKKKTLKNIKMDIWIFGNIKNIQKKKKNKLKKRS